jgi:alpha-glucosidase
VLYQGDELGLEQVEILPDRIRDVAGRDGCRTPLPWTREGGWTDPWLPLGNTARNVEDQRNDPRSILNFVREMIARRRSSPDLLAGRYEALTAPSGVWAYRRGDSTSIAINLSDKPARFDQQELDPWESAVISPSERGAARRTESPSARRPRSSPDT